MEICHVCLRNLFLLFGAFFLTALFVFVSVPSFSHAQETVNAGLVQGIWFSDTHIVEGRAVRVYAAIQNQSDYALGGSVELLVDDVIIAERDFSAPPKSVVEISTEHIFNSGTRQVSMRIARAFQKEGGEAVLFLNGEQHEIAARVVNVDTDHNHNGIGDAREPEVGSQTTLSRIGSEVASTTGVLVDVFETHFPTTSESARAAGVAVFERVDPVVQNLQKKVDTKKEKLTDNIRGFKKPDAQEDEPLWRTAFGSGEAQLANTARLSAVWLLSLVSFALKHWLWSTAALLFLFLWIFFRRRYGRNDL